MNKKKFLTILVIFLLATNTHSAKEIQIYADKIDYDSNENIVATGNVKIINNKEILTSSIIIVDQVNKKIILPKSFYYLDEQNNYYYGTSGEFSTDFENGEVNNVKILLSDGSRLVGDAAIKRANKDLIKKGVYSSCNSKIKIGKFLCPIWQVDGEKILHDKDNLFIHTKHAKMRILNTPVYYAPYLIQPSPLRKKRKSGFLNPSIAFNFLDTKISQSFSTPYYFAIDVDKELLLTPTINYGGGVDASQRTTYKYNQVVSGGNLSLNISTDTNLENENNESWLRDGSLILAFNQNLNENYKISLLSAFQTSPTYLRRTDQNNILNRKNSLNTTFDLNGYDVIEKNDLLTLNISGYQVVRNNEDNKKTPTSLPYATYTLGKKYYKNNNIDNKLTFYNIFRDAATSDHAQQQQKFEHAVKTDNEFYSLHTKVNVRTELYTQFYNIEGKKIDSADYKGTYFRSFPMSGIFFQTPFVNKKYDIFFTPKLFGVINSSQSNSDKISNEESTDYKYSLLNFESLSRYTGTDKLENSRRISYGFDISKNKYNFEIGQSYEFNKNRNQYTKKVGLNDYMSDLLGSTSYIGITNEEPYGLDATYGFRFNTDQGLMKSHNVSLANKNLLGTFNLGYTMERKEVNSILEDGSETAAIGFASKEFLKYSKIFTDASFDLTKDDPTNHYNIYYQYFDECFGVDLSFERRFYEDRDLKPSDMVTLMFSFKNLGSYKSTNLAVSEKAKQDIRWESFDIDDAKFKN